MSEIKQTKRVEQILRGATNWCDSYRHEFVMPEHLLLSMLECKQFNYALDNYCDVNNLTSELCAHLDEIEVVPDEFEYEPEPSQQMLEVVGTAYQTMLMSEADAVDMPHLVKGILELEDSWATYILKRELDGQEASFMSSLLSTLDEEDDIVIISSDGVIIRIPVNSISVFARPSKGVRVMKVKDGERVVTLTDIEHSDEETNSEETENSETTQENNE